jgi:hypothetical protein
VGYGLVRFRFGSCADRDGGGVLRAARMASTGFSPAE